jgi:probable F420-dependent oxidoreductase
MRFGVVFPQLEIGTGPAVIKEYAQTAEGLGYDHLLAYDHVLGADTTIAERRDWRGPYTHESQFHELFVLYGYLAGLTERLELVTGVIILPQRQTALVAKQAAEVCVLSGGRLRLGVGIGWNAVEYKALNENFHNRGRRSVEQIQLLRRLFTEPVVDFKGRYHTIPQAGLNPLPVQQIPIWLGGMADAVLERVAKYGDGWFPQFRPAGENARPMMEKLRGLVREAGRDMSEIGIEGRFTATGTPDEWRTAMDEWRAIGATHVSVNTMGVGLTSPREHIDLIRRVREEVTA